MQQHKIDPTQWALPEAETLAVVPGKVQRRRRHFIKVPWSWVDRLAGARHIATYRYAEEGRGSAGNKMAGPAGARTARVDHY